MVSFDLQELLKDGVSNEHKWEIVRHVRDRLLSTSDWTQLLDSPLDSETQNEWQQYRQELRDLPSTYENPDEVVIPSFPD